MAQEVAYRVASDFYAVEDLLTDVQRSVRETVRRFVDREVLPHIGRWWLEGRFPVELVPRLAELGVLGANLPEAYGCAGLDSISYGVIMQELERGDSGLRSFVSVQGSLVMYPIYAFGSEEQRRHYLPKLARGELIGCFGLTEPTAGSDPAAMNTRARRTARGWVITGTKMWITNGSIAHLAIVWARDESDAVRGFIVPTDLPGFSAHDIHTKISMRASVTSELVLEEVEVPEELALPGGVGLSKALSCLTQARYGIAWGAVGAAVACFEEALSYAQGRIAFGRPIAATQIIQERLVDMLTKITTSQLLAYRLGQLKDAGRMHYAQVSLAKRHNVRAALEVARDARLILGAYGITAEYHAMRHAANLESVDTYEGTYDVHTLIVGRQITGQSAFGRD
ncbi:MAG: acyl-CoA dehydrogenase family protein [Armatimonadetes bacterium]|nr:acyl-CoA dehydrogenase family protein [Armatimonadota bacterium]MDW8153641.1 acyl-CoA dehydrogenase family protein [Armatimonadota bacterium]